MSVDLYNSAYSNYGSDAEAAVRQATYGEDIGQSSWMTAADWLRFARDAGVTERSEVLEVGCGSGGPAVYLAERAGCRVTGIDVNEHGIRNAQALATSRGVADRVRFEQLDASVPLPFAAESFDAVLSNDAMCHIANRAAVLADWHRVLRPGGCILYTDAMIVTGIVSQQEFATRSSIGFYVFLPPGLNERLIRDAGLELLRTDDLTSRAEAIAARWRDARAEHRAPLEVHEGTANFEGLQRFLDCVHRLSAERRVSRFGYLARRSGQSTG